MAHWRPWDWIGAFFIFMGLAWFFGQVLRIFTRCLVVFYTEWLFRRGRWPVCRHEYLHYKCSLRRGHFDPVHVSAPYELEDGRWQRHFWRIYPMGTSSYVVDVKPPRELERLSQKEKIR